MRMIACREKWARRVPRMLGQHRGLFMRCSAIGLLLFGNCLFALAAQTEVTTHRGDNSDWWSDYNLPDSDASATTQDRQVTASNFEILGIHLAKRMFSEAAAKLGPAPTISRGDASTGRLQRCYVSAQDGGKVHLVFEQGEVDYTFYLFEDGANWNGSDLCVRSNLVSRRLATASGIHLGMSPSQVVSVLGQPNNRRRNALIYSFSVRRKTSAEDQRRMRAEGPQMSDKDFHANYDFYNWGAGFFARFADSKLEYLSGSTSLTY
jgi:hypothetical protein